MWSNFELNLYSMAIQCNENSGTPTSNTGLADAISSSKVSQHEVTNSELFLQQNASQSQQSSSHLYPQEETIKGKRKPIRPPSIAWDHFTKLSDGYHTLCNYCAKQYACAEKKNGTSNLLSHLTNMCSSYLNREQKKQKTLAFPAKKGGEGGWSSKLVHASYSANACQEAVAKMIIIDELSFRFVENERFRLVYSVLEPRFSVPSHSTVTRETA